jgi:formate--tetrahydrofolate ligase
VGVDRLPPDIELARKAKMLPALDIAAKLGIQEKDVELYGRYKAKVSLDLFRRKKDAKAGKLILVTAMTPTPAGEGKTTMTIGLGDALNQAGKKATICLREPSLGPCFGMKGGAAGGGMSQVVPMEDINLHFTGDFHAISIAHNLLAAMVDNHIHQGNRLGLEPRKVSWGRVLDLNERALRKIVLGLGGTGSGIPRECGFEIAAASEVMAIFCISESIAELKERLGRIVVGYDRDGRAVTARELKAPGAMAVLLKDAISPNLVQTLENTPAFVHGGPFGNIAHGCNSVIATKLAMRLSEYTVTEAGFGSDLGLEKFMDIKCRSAGISPDAVVVVATVRALKYHGGAALQDSAKPDLVSLEKGIDNLKKHVENVHRFGLPAVVAVNSFASDSDEEIKLIRDKCDHLGVEIVPCENWGRGGAGAEALARAVVKLAETTKKDFRLLYPDDLPLWQKVRTVAQEIYGAEDIMADKKLRDRFKALQDTEYAKLPVCVAKTQYSLSTDPNLRGRPRHFDVPVRDLKLCAGAGFLVVLTGEVMTMPGLPAVPAAESIDIDEAGRITGLF